MPRRQPRSSQQIKSDRRALRRLRDTGLYSGKIDLRKPPSSAQKRALKKYDDVIKGRAAVLKPKNPKSYKNIFRVKGDKVIVPKRKGERVRVEKKTGEIVGTRGVNGQKVRMRYKARKELERGRVQYAIPFIRGRDKRGKPILHWFRFPDYDSLSKFMAGYNYDNWQDFVVEEELDARGDAGLDEQYKAGTPYQKPKGAKNKAGAKLKKRRR